MDLSRTISEINGDFSRKSQNFSTHREFCAPAEGFPLEFGTGARSQKTRTMELPGREISLTITSAVWIQCANVTDGRTDRRTATGRQQRPRLCTPSRGNDLTTSAAKPQHMQ